MQEKRKGGSKLLSYSVLVQSVGPQHPESYQALRQKLLSSALGRFTQLRERSTKVQATHRVVPNNSTGHVFP